jgi:hypothetical protein
MPASINANRTLDRLYTAGGGGSLPQCFRRTGLLQKASVIQKNGRYLVGIYLFLKAFGRGAPTQCHPQANSVIRCNARRYTEEGGSIASSPLCYPKGRRKHPCFIQLEHAPPSGGHARRKHAGFQKLIVVVLEAHMACEKLAR